MAMGLVGPLKKELEAASGGGFVPLAFRQHHQDASWTGGYFPYFIFFTSASSPSSASGGGVSAGGAASGGGGASGSA